MQAGWAVPNITEQRPQVALLTNVPTPYRMPVFEALAEDVDLTVCFCQAEDPDRRWQVAPHSDRVNYRVYPACFLSLPGHSRMVWNPGLWPALRSAPFDAYIAGENFTNLLSVLTVWRVARFWRRPFVVWSEAIDTAYASGHLVSNAYRRWLYRKADAFIAYGSKAKAYLVRRGAPAGRITIGLQVVPSKQLPGPVASKATLGLAGKTVVLSVGYFVPRKGLEYLVRAFRQAASEDDVLVLVGSGPEEAALKAESLGDRRIFFPGYCEGAEKTSWYAAADVFVLPTLHDPWGLVVNEAMAFGLPIVVTDAAGCTDIVLDNGLVVPARDINALADAVSCLLRDESLRSRMGQRSREVIATYTVEAARNAFLQTIRFALESGQSRSGMRSLCAR